MSKSEVESHTCTAPEAKFRCRLCGNAFSTKASLTRHMKLHIEVEPVKCPHCDRQFRNEMLLKKHQVIHSDERGFSCTKCDKAFKRAEDLVKHNRIHTGEAPYKCRLLLIIYSSIMFLQLFSRVTIIFSSI